MGDADPKLFRWDYNFHELPEGVDSSRNGVDDLTAVVQSNRCVCVMQKWGGKREVMYTSFKTVGDSVDYFQVCDSDTKLHANATLELVRVLDGIQYRACLPELLWMCILHLWAPGTVPQLCITAILESLVRPEVPGFCVHVWR